MHTSEQWVVGRGKKRGDSGRKRGPRRWKRLVLIGLVIGLLLFVAAVVAALALEPAVPAAADLSWQVIAAGGSTMSSSSYTLLSTTGQPVAGTVSGTDHTLLSGYWYGFQQFVWTVLLPVVMGAP